MLVLARRAGTLTLAEWAILAESVTLAVGIELALRRLLASPQFLVRAEKEPASVPTGRPCSSSARSTTGPVNPSVESVPVSRSS